MNISFLKSNFFKSLMLILASISNPLFSISKPIFLLLLFTVILVVLIYCDVVNFRTKFDSICDWIIYKFSIPWLQIAFFYFAIFIIVYLIAGTKYNQSDALIIFICWLIALITIYGVCRNIFSVVLKIRELATGENVFSLQAVLLTFFSILFISIAPDVVFSRIYLLFFTTIENIDLSNLEGFYLSVIISNTLPIGEKHTNYISIISDNAYIYIFQIVQVIMNKIIDLFIIGIILNYFFVVINGKRT